MRAMPRRERPEPVERADQAPKLVTERVPVRVDPERIAARAEASARGPRRGGGR